ncbi:MAG: vancomycin resistance protein VanW [Clostridiales bacterium]|nr:vancomycin resistance protein VanW [Clostridiales bacterium]
MKQVMKIFLFIICIFFINLYIISCSTNQPKPEQKPQKSAPKTVEVPKPSPVKTPVPTPPPTTPPPTVEVNGILSSFKTTILDKSKDRVHNLNLASQIIYGHVVHPGEIFSFNKVVGERLPERGFRKAIVIVKDKRGYDEGGGICQVSSTLFNAAQQAGLEIIERHSHSKDIHYLPQGQDAAIAYGSLDLKFKNTKNFPIKIETYVEGDKMVAKILRAE